jgi:hypothetical protein
MKRSRVVVCGGGAQDRPLKLHIPGRALRDRGQLLAHQQAPRKVQIGNSQGLQSVPQSMIQKEDAGVEGKNGPQSFGPHDRIERVLVDMKGIGLQIAARGGRLFPRVPMVRLMKVEKRLYVGEKEGIAIQKENLRHLPEREVVQ